MSDVALASLMIVILITLVMIWFTDSFRSPKDLGKTLGVITTTIGMVLFISPHFCVCDPNQTEYHIRGFPIMLLGLIGLILGKIGRSRK